MHQCSRVLSCLAGMVLDGVLLRERGRMAKGWAPGAPVLPVALDAPVFPGALAPGRHGARRRPPPRARAPGEGAGAWCSGASSCTRCTSVPGCSRAWPAWCSAASSCESAGAWRRGGRMVRWCFQLHQMHQFPVSAATRCSEGGLRMVRWPGMALDSDVILRRRLVPCAGADTWCSGASSCTRCTSVPVSAAPRLVC